MTKYQQALWRKLAVDGKVMAGGLYNILGIGTTRVQEIRPGTWRVLIPYTTKSGKWGEVWGHPESETVDEMLARTVHSALRLD